MPFLSSARPAAVLIAVAYVILALAYGLANPPFEATDEVRHFRYVRYIGLHRSLPPVSVEASKELQAHHPPLYYALAALITAPIPAEAGTDYSPPINPFWGFRYYEPSTDNKNQYLHSPDDRWPFISGTVLILYIARWLSTLFGLGTVIMAYWLGRTAFPEQPVLALGGMAFVAFNPTFLHSTSSANNDAAAAFFGAWAVVEAAGIAQNGTSWQAATRLGAALGLGLMSKVSVGVLALAAVVGYSTLLIRASGRRLAARDFALVVAIAGLIAGWWFARNYALTGDWMGLSDYQSAWVGEADRARLIREALSGLPYAWTTVWARFDYGQIVLPDGIYAAWGILCVLAVIGLVRNRSQLRLPGVSIVMLAILVSLAGWVALMVTIPATAHARHILPAYPAIGLVLVTGWLGFLPRIRTNKHEWNLMGLGVWFFGFALYALVGFLGPAFAYPRVVTILPTGVTPISANFEGVAEIVGYRLSTVEARPGERVDVTVYWKPLAQTATPLQVFVHFIDSQGIITAQRDTYPGLGNAPTKTWRAGQVFADTYRVFISETAYTPERLVVRVGLWNVAESRPILVEESEALEIGSMALNARAGEAPNPIAINFENKLTLIGYETDKRAVAPGEALVLTTYWRAAASDADYWAYAHVVGGDGRIWAIADSVMVPLITQWSLDTINTEAREIVLATDTPPGQYTLEFGVTRVTEAGQSRLPILAEDGHEIGDHIDLTRILVQP